MILLEEIKFTNQIIVQPIIIEEQLEHRTTRTRSRDIESSLDEPIPKRLQTGGFYCNKCNKTYKTNVTFKKHKCKY